MSKHLEALKKRAAGEALRAVGEGMGVAVGVTQDELITAKAKLFGAKVERFPLRQVSAVRTIPNPAANVLGLDFSTNPPRTVTVMYEADAQTAFTTIISILKEYLPVEKGKS